MKHIGATQLNYRYSKPKGHSSQNQPPLLHYLLYQTTLIKLQKKIEFVPDVYGRIVHLNICSRFI